MSVYNNQLSVTRIVSVTGASIFPQIWLGTILPIPYPHSLSLRQSPVPSFPPNSIWVVWGSLELSHFSVTNGSDYVSGFVATFVQFALTLSACLVCILVSMAKCEDLLQNISVADVFTLPKLGCVH